MALLRAPPAHHLARRRRWQACEDLGRRLGVLLGQVIVKVQNPEATDYSLRLQSLWMNHWGCGDWAARQHGIHAIWGCTTLEIRCWKKDNVDKRNASFQSSYFPMLLSCKVM